MSGINFRTADAADDEGIRRLLRESSMAGGVAISLRREPSYFAASDISGDETTIVALEAGRIICVGSIGVRERYVNGVVMPVGYLGQLRLAASHAGCADVLRRGYAYFHAMKSTLGAAVYFTSIATDNHRALRLLARGARGLPTYVIAGELVTVLIATSRCVSPRRRVKRQEEASSAAASIVDRLSTANASYQLAPAWTRDDLERMRLFGLSEVSRTNVDAEGLAALWDQRKFKQVVITGYSARVRILRKLYNVAAMLRRRVALPPIGSELDQAFVSHLVMKDDRPHDFTALLNDIGGEARATGIKALTLSLDARDKRLTSLIRTFRPRLYRTKLFNVTWPGDNPISLDDRLLYPDAALL